MTISFIYYYMPLYRTIGLRPLEWDIGQHNIICGSPTPVSNGPHDGKNDSLVMYASMQILECKLWNYKPGNMKYLDHCVVYKYVSGVVEMIFRGANKSRISLNAIEQDHEKMLYFLTYNWERRPYNF